MCKRCCRRAGAQALAARATTGRQSPCACPLPPPASQIASADSFIPGLGLVGLSYFVLMFVFGAFGKKWLVDDLWAHGDRDSCMTLE